VGFLYTVGVGQTCPHLCHTAGTITSRGRDHMSPEIKVALLERSKVLVTGIPGRCRGRQLQMGDVIILKLSRGREGILKIAYNALKL
jgi:hypothetical protein